MNLGRYGTQGAYGYGANPANQGGAISHVSVVREISPAAHANIGAYGGTGGLPYNGAAGWPNPGVGYNNPAGFPFAGAGRLPYTGAAHNGLGIHGGAAPFSGAGNLGFGAAYTGVGAGYGGLGAGYSGLGAGYAGLSAGYPYSGAGYNSGVYSGTGYGGVATSYSNIYNGPLRSNFANSAYGSPLSYGGYGNRQAW